MFCSVCWGGNISKLEGGWKRLKNTGHVVGKPLDFTRKETVQKTNANIKRPYTPNETLL